MDTNVPQVKRVRNHVNLVDYLCSNKDFTPWKKCVGYRENGHFHNGNYSTPAVGSNVQQQQFDPWCLKILLFLLR